jgi:hypothetical protein
LERRAAKEVMDEQNDRGIHPVPREGGDFVEVLHDNIEIAVREVPPKVSRPGH